jgi:hypothetical protein
MGPTVGQRADTQRNKIGRIAGAPSANPLMDRAVALTRTLHLLSSRQTLSRSGDRILVKAGRKRTHLLSAPD